MPVSVCGVLEFTKTNDKLKIKGGQVSGRPIDQAPIRHLADLPGKEVLLAVVLSAMQAVPTSLVRALNGIVLNLLYVLKALEREKGESV